MAHPDYRPLETAGSLPRLPKVSEMLADRLRGMILGKGLKPGDRLSSENELISHYGAARNTVREALRLLESEGLIEIRRGRQGGILVRQPDLDRIGHSIAVLLAMNGAPLRDLMNFRMLIEPAASAAAARTASDDQIAWLRSVIRDEEHGDLRDNVSFHQAVAVCTNNTFLEMVITSLTHELTLHSTSETLSKGDLSATRRAHRAVVKAIGNHDAAAAEKAMLRHIERFRDVLGGQGRLDETIVPRSRWLSQA